MPLLTKGMFVRMHSFEPTPVVEASEGRFGYPEARLVRILLQKQRTENR